MHLMYGDADVVRWLNSPEPSRSPRVEARCGKCRGDIYLKESPWGREGLCLSCWKKRQEQKEVVKIAMTTSVTGFAAGGLGRFSAIEFGG